MVILPLISCSGGNKISMGWLGRYLVQAMKTVVMITAIRNMIAIAQYRFVLVSATGTSLLCLQQI
jgi:hypothetical protein